MAEIIGSGCTLVRAFAEFGLLPDLLALRRASDTPMFDETGTRIFPFMPFEKDEELTILKWGTLLERTGVNTDHIEPEDTPPRNALHTVLATDAWQLGRRLGWIGLSGLTGTGERLAAIGERSWDERTEADDRTVEATIAESLRERYVGISSFAVIDLVQSGARLLSQTQDVWAMLAPGLLLVEFEALIHWALKSPIEAMRLRDALIENRTRAVDRYGGPSADLDADENTVRLADATAQLYFDSDDLAGDTGLTVTGVRSTAMLLTYAGLLDEFSMGPVNYLMPPTE